MVHQNRELDTGIGKSFAILIVDLLLPVSGILQRSHVYWKIDKGNCDKIS